jgi:copper chaperone CopZ
MIVQTTQLQITGMSCQACVSHVEQALRGVSGVAAVKVDLAAGKAEIQHQGASLSQMIEAVVEAGYEATVLAG